MVFTLGRNGAGEIDGTAAILKCRAPYWRVQSIPRAPNAHLLMQIRHNLVVPEKPFFRRGRYVLKAAHHVEVREARVSRMKRSRIGLALAGTAACAVACAVVWPHARDSWAILAAQDDPAELADVQINSALRNSQKIIAENIEAALALGEDTDRLVLGLAAAGLAVTAATYVSLGGAAPLRAGLTLVKDARKVGRLGEGLTEWAGRSAREVVDMPVLQNAVASGSVMRPGQTVGAIQAAFHAEKVGALVRLAKDVGRVSEKAGIRAAQDTLKIAENPKDVARAARLAEQKGGQTRAILKVLGRGALLLAG